jgi:outer membrane beta-barrel protein
MRFVTALAATLCAVGTTAALEKTANAQEILLTGPLKGQPPARNLRLYREGRFEIAPAMSFGVLDEYRHMFIAGLRLQYNFTDWIGIGLWGGYGFSGTTDLSDQINDKAPRNNLTAVNVNHSLPVGGKAEFGDQVARLQWVVAPQVTVTPFRGKLALFQKVFVDTEAYIFGGFALVGLQERGNCGGGSGEPSCNTPASFALASRIAPTGTFGLGLTFFMADFINLGIEYRALPFSWNRGGFDSRGGGSNANFPDQKINSDDSTFKFNQMFTVSVGFMLGGRKTSD